MLSVALALVLSCWSAAPAFANSDLLAGPAAPLAGPGPVHLPAPAPGTATLQESVAPTADSVRPVVAAAAEAVASTAAPAQTAADTAYAEGSTPPAGAATPAARGRRARTIRASAAQTRAEASRSGARRPGGNAAQGPASTDAGALAPLLLGAGARAAAPAPESSLSAAPGPAAPAPDPPSGPDRRSTALQGSGATGIPTSLLLGGLALLLGAVALAGPRLQRLLSTGPAACRPAAFVALLERPG